MAISWDTQITNVNNPRADITFTRTDDTTQDVWSYSYKNRDIGTPVLRAALLDDVWAKWQLELSKRTAEAAFIDNLEQQANSNLDAREV